MFVTVEWWGRKNKLSLITPPKKTGGVIWDTSLKTSPAFKNNILSVRNQCYYYKVKFMCVGGWLFSQTCVVPNYPTKISKFKIGLIHIFDPHSHFKHHNNYFPKTWELIELLFECPALPHFFVIPCPKIPHPFINDVPHPYIELLLYSSQ